MNTFYPDPRSPQLKELSFPEMLQAFGIGKPEIAALNSYNDPAVKQKLCQHPFKAVQTKNNEPVCDLCGKKL